MAYLLLWIGEKGWDIHAIWKVDAEPAKKLET